MKQDIQHCIQECQECHQTCLETFTYSAQQGGEHVEADRLRLLLDCAEMCQTNANIMTRGSDLHALTCEVCAEICQRCAEDCEEMSDDRHMKACAELCRRCAESCQQMAV